MKLILIGLIGGLGCTALVGSGSPERGSIKTTVEPKTLTPGEGWMSLETSVREPGRTDRYQWELYYCTPGDSGKQPICVKAVMIEQKPTTAKPQ